KRFRRGNCQRQGKILVHCGEKKILRHGRTRSRLSDQTRIPTLQQPPYQRRASHSENGYSASARLGSISARTCELKPRSSFNIAAKAIMAALSVQSHGSAV